MDKKYVNLDGKSVRFFGFKYDAKAFFVTMGIALGVLLLLVALTILGIDVSWYGICFGLGFVVALGLAGQMFRERGIDSEYPFTLIWWVFPLSILGARIYFLTFNSDTFEFVDIFTIWKGGLAVYGGIIGGAIGLIISSLVHKVSIPRTTDCVVPLLSIGQAFGRIGCIFGHCCYGVEVTNKALQFFPIALNIRDSYYFATNFYESILDLGLFFVLTIILRKTKITGITTFSYLVGYGLVRFILEHFREPSQTLFLGTMPVSQLLSVVLVIVGVIGICTLLLVNNRRRNKAE